MPEPHIPRIPDITLAPLAPWSSEPGVIAMRAAVGADLAHARVLEEQVRITLPFLRLDPARLVLIRGILSHTISELSRASALLADETFLPRADGDAAA